MVVAQPLETKGRKVRPAIVDTDVHNELDSEKDLYPFLDARWLTHLQTYGMRGYSGASYPRFMNRRNDSKPPSGRAEGSDCSWTSIQLLDEWNISHAILNPLAPGAGQLDPEFSAALCSAVNDWQVHEWLDKEPRMRASIICPFEHADLAVAEIEKRATDRRFVQVQFSGRPREPMGRRTYWPIYEVAEHYGLKIMSHAFGSGGQPITGAGWPSFYIEDHVGPAQSMQANIISLVGEGVFERFPRLRVVSAENGFGWVPAMNWRMDASYQLFKSEVPYLKRLPSEYVSEYCYFCTQPIEEPHRRGDFMKIFEQWPAAADRLMFASDYAHWDWDSPGGAIPNEVPDELQRKLYFHNAAQLYGFA
ncbi:MAG TPA: amidohydrolase family protein [Chloroflexota bacterium]|nr:amidohydrolase family protein [Chloroflexota bacterium]